MGKKSSPKSPAPIDPGKSMGEYLFGKQDFKSAQGITDPVLQGRLLESEAAFRPLYTALELSDIQTMAQGRSEEIANPAYEGIQNNLSFLDEDLAEVDEKGNFVLKGNKRKKAEARRKEMERSLQRLPPTLAPQGGLFDLLEDQAKRAGALQREELGLQRADDVSALQEYAPQVVDAYRAADPYSTELADLGSERAKGLIGAERSEAEQLLGQRGLEFAASTGELTPLEQRRAQQSAREASVARGRGMDQSALYGEMQSRMAQEMNKQEREMAMGSQLLGQQAGLQQQRFGQEQTALGGAFGMQRQMAGDIGSTLLGRSSSAIGLGQQGLGQSIGMAAGQMGPQLFDPNVGMNMALAQRGQDISFQGAQAQAGAAQGAGTSGMIGGLFGGAGAALGGYFGG